ncbi:M24 family metallopeptidase [Chachezhania sediminis]|uniref:M24 family metallopeptidase n=1 Tax=Chachezhania sediminis TaxID=2599291 RepID=UPI0018EEEABD|nr:M24 family metallopeptidase [Chachezhania sediminis]
MEHAADLPTALPFDMTEYDRRLRAVDARMEAAGLDALIVADPSNMAWLTGYDGWSFYVPQAVIYRPGSAPWWWGRYMDSFGALRTVWLPADHILHYTDDYVQAGARHAMQDLSAQLAGLGMGTLRIGVELDNYYYSARAHAELVQGLPDATLVDATGVVNWCRTVKSEAELTFMRRAARISETLVDGVLDRIRPGLPKNEMVAGVLSDMATGADGHWGDYPAIVPLLPSGADASAAHLTWDGRPFAAGEATFFELSGCYRRYHAPFCRTVYLGEPPDRMRKVETALVDGLEAGLDAARAGAVAGDVARALHSTLAKHGITRTGRCGYPIGISYPPDWGERTISFRESDETVLEPGMTFHFMPGLWMEDWGLEITETILIREGGPAESLCNRPRELFAVV